MARIATGAQHSPKIKWADFAIEIFKQANKEVIVNRVTTEEYGVSIAKDHLILD